MIFFVLSGFLIGYQAQSKSNYTFTEFFCDRFSRIYAGYLPALILIVIADLTVLQSYLNFPAASVAFTTFAGNVLMLHYTPFDRMVEWLPNIPPWGTGRQLWTVAVEWWLYILFGVMFFVRTASNRQRVAMTLLVLPALMVVFFFTTVESLGIVWIISAAVGMAFAVYPNANPSNRLAFYAALFFVVALFARFNYLDAQVSMNVYDLQFTIFTTGLIVASLIFVGTSRVASGIFKSSGPLWRWLAGISYSLYLTHLTIVIGYYYIRGIDYALDVVIVCAISIVFADLFYRLFDSRHRNLGLVLKRLLKVTEQTGSRQHYPGYGVYLIPALLAGIASTIIYSWPTSDKRNPAFFAEAAAAVARPIDDVRAGDEAFYGVRSPPSPEKGKVAWRRSAMSGSWDALVRLAVYSPDDMPTDRTRADILQEAVDYNDPEALLATMGDSSGNIDPLRSKAMAERAYLAASRLNNSKDRVDVIRGEVVLKRLADAGHAESANMYGDAIRGGRTRVNLPMSIAMEYWRRSAAQNNSLGAFLLGETYYSGLGDVHPDKSKAIGYWTIAAELGYEPAIARLSDVYSDEGNVTKTLHYLTMAYERTSDPEIAYQIGKLYRSGGRDLSPDNKNALVWLKRAADGGHVQARDEVGR